MPHETMPATARRLRFGRPTASRLPLRSSGVIDEACLKDLRLGLRLGSGPVPPSAQGCSRNRRLSNRNAQADTLLGLLAALESKDLYTARHSAQVETYARCLCTLLRLDAETARIVRVAAVLHDLGKIGVPDAILTKPGPLTRDEFEVMKQHPEIGVAILKPIAFLEPALPLVLHHHEWHDGTGYPAGLRADAIPDGAKIIQMADCIDAMMSPRCYRRGFDVQRVLGEIERGTGAQFDPDVAEAATAWLRSGPRCLAITHFDARTSAPIR